MSQRRGRARRRDSVLLFMALLLVACRDSGGDAFVGSATTVRTTATSTTLASTTSTSAGSSNTTAAPTTTGQTTTTRPRTTSSVPGRVSCSALQLAVETSVLRPTYRPGETVQIQATLRNRSDQPCFYTSYGISTRIDDAAGQPVRPAPFLFIDSPEEAALEPGQTLGSSPTWDQQVCSGSGSPCTKAPPGRYRARAIWQFQGSPVEGSAFFDLVG